VKVLYLAGSRNCGSTLLDAILGNTPGAYSLGEFGGFHRYASSVGCDCGETPASCSACAAVVKALDAGGDLVRLRRLGPMPLNERRAHWTVLATPARAEYARVADAMFDAVAAATGAEVLIDSSKNVSRAAALVHESRHDVRVLHLVRDGRGYVESRRRRAEVTGARHRPGLALGGWAAKNLLISAALRPGLGPGRYLLCRYEDVVQDLAGQLRRIGAFAGLDTTGLAEAATGQGLDRHHLFEPPRRVDYRRVRLDPARLESQRLAPERRDRYWALGGFVSALWGYDRGQSYLPKAGAGV
jgi:hypothetical protein